MTYLPSNLISSSYQYITNGDYIQIRTNQGCYTSGTQQYCQCYYVYPNMDYLVSNVYNCTPFNNNQSLSYTNFSSNFWYRVDISNILIIFLILFIFIILLPYKIMSRPFGRWLKL